MDVIFEDNHLLVINKPHGLLTQPSGTDQDSLETQAKEWLKEKYQKPGNVFLEAVHRLDKPVSGIVVFGKTSKALTRLNVSIREKKCQKIYWAFVEGILLQEQEILQHFILHEEFTAKIGDQTTPGAKLSQLTYTTLSRTKVGTLIEIELDTGRYHQIRLQMSCIGFPIWGDKKYGGKMFYAGEGIALHHKCLHIPHPITQEVLILEAPLPSVFQNISKT